tara:strand:+ start:521 stop:766 length:246 start_codon:yes stop_codon:yes gene_type:complete
MAPMQDNTAAKRRGRPKGSTSFVNIKLSDLADNLGPNANVSVSKKWLETIGIHVSEPTPILTVSSSTDELDAQEAIQFVIH